MNDTAHDLILEIEAELHAELRAPLSTPVGEEDSVIPKYAERIRAVDEVRFLTEVFREVGTSYLTQWALRLAFVWKDFSFAQWRTILREISDNELAVYGFTWAASELLALDVASMIESDPEISDRARRRFAWTFREGVPKATDWAREMLENQGVDCQAMWRRLASEGAPMNIRLTQAQGE